MRGWACGVLFLAACAPEGKPTKVAWQAGSASWPANSLVALDEALLAGVDAVHIELFLTSDRTPVGSHWPYLDPEICTTFAGAAIEAESVWLLQQDATTLQVDYRCGGTAPAAFPEANTAPTPPMLLEEALARLAEVEPVAVYLEARWFDGVSHEPEVVAAEVLGRWDAWGLEHELIVVSEAPQVVRAFEDRSDLTLTGVETRLSWPVQPVRGKVWSVVRELGQGAGLESAVPVAREARADGVLVVWSAAERLAVDAALDEGLTVDILAPRGGASARAAARWPVDAVLSPELWW